MLESGNGGISSGLLAGMGVRRHGIFVAGKVILDFTVGFNGGKIVLAQPFSSSKKLEKFR